MADQDDLKTIKAINAGPDDYRRAGDAAGSKAADKFAAYCFANPEKLNADAAKLYHQERVDAACAQMRSTGSSEDLLEAWTEAYWAALQRGLAAFMPSGAS